MNAEYYKKMLEKKTREYKIKSDLMDREIKKTIAIIWLAGLPVPSDKKKFH